MIEQPTDPPPPAPEPTKIAIGQTDTGRRIGLPEVLVATVIYLIVQLAGAGVILLAFGGDAVISGAAVPTVLLVLTAAVSAGVAAGVAGILRVRSASALGLLLPTGRWLLIGAACGFAGFLVNRLVILIYVAITGDVSNPQQGMANTAMGGAWWQFGLLLLFGAVLAPIGEELLFRGIGFGWLRRWGFPLAALLSSVLFGLAHGINVVLPAAILLGLIHAWLYERSGSIWPAVVSHAVNNLVVFVLARVVIALGLA